jgi:outer membrane protein OmpA-like peptidoglycan-associated protein
MAINLLELIKEHLSEDVVANFASLIGETPNNLQISLNTALPALLSGLVEKSSDESGAGNLFKVLTDGIHDGGILSNLGALSRGGEETSKLLAEGKNLLSSLFGDKAGSITSLVASAGGITQKSSDSLLGFVTPVVLGLLGKTLKIENNASIGGLMSFLTGQVGFLKNLVPSGFDQLSASAAQESLSVGLSDYDIAVSTLDEVPEPSSPTEEFSIGETFDKIDNAIEEFAVDTMSAAKNVAEDVMASASDIGSNFVEESKEFVGDITESAGKLGSGIVEESKDFAKNAADVFEEGAEGGKKLLPWFLIAAALALVWGLLKSCGTAPEPEKSVTALVPPASAPAAAPVAEPALAPEPAKPEPEAAKEPAAPPVNSSIFEKNLSTGFVIKAAKDGFESKLIGFIEGNEAVSKDLWFTMDGITFDTNRATIKAESKAQINHIVEVLKAYPKVKIKIGGYTDNTGKPANNQELSDKRAKEVRKAVVSAGIAADRIDAEGYGSEHPVASNDTAEGRQKNRRIDVQVTEK